MDSFIDTMNSTMNLGKKFMKFITELKPTVKSIFDELIIMLNSYGGFATKISQFLVSHQENVILICTFIVGPIIGIIRLCF